MRATAILSAVLLMACQTAPEVELAQDYLILGTAYYEQKNWSQAERFLGRAVALDPTNRAARYNLALSLLQQSQPEAAQPHLETLLQSDPDNTLLLKALGYALFWQKRFAQAQEIYRRILTLLPEDRETLFNLGLTAAESGDTEAGLRHLEAWLDQEPTPPDSIWPILEPLYRRSGNEDGLLRVLPKLIEKNRNDLARMAELAALYERKERWQDQIDLLTRIDDVRTQQGQADPQVRWSIGEIHLLRLRQQDPAVEWFGKAIQAGFRDARRAESLLSRSEVLNPDFLRNFFVERRLLSR